MNKSTVTKLIVPIIMWATAGLPCVNAQTEPVSEKYRVVLKLNDNSFLSLKNSRFVKAEVPKSQRDKIVAVKIIKLGAFFDEPAEIEAETSVSRGVMNVKITDAALEQLAYRPLLIKVTENGFSKVLLEYQPTKTEKSSPTPTALSTQQIDENSQFFVRRDEENGIVAGPPDASVLRIQTNYGSYDVPWSLIEAVYLGQTKNVLVILQNGDKISGKLNENRIKLVTAWGEHEIEASKLFSFTRTRDQRFLATTSQDGVKFRLYNTTDNRQSAGY